MCFLPLPKLQTNTWCYRQQHAVSTMAPAPHLPLHPMACVDDKMAQMVMYYPRSTAIRYPEKIDNQWVLLLHRGLWTDADNSWRSLDACWRFLTASGWTWYTRLHAQVYTTKSRSTDMQAEPKQKDVFLGTLIVDVADHKIRRLM